MQLCITYRNQYNSHTVQSRAHIILNSFIVTVPDAHKCKGLSHEPVFIFIFPAADRNMWWW